MASGTVKYYIDTFDPKKEVFLIEDMANADVLTSRKFATIQAASLTQNDAVSTGSIAVSFSGTSATIHATGVSSGTFTLTLWGE